MLSAPQSPTPEGYLSKEDIARETGAEPYTVQRWILAGLPATQFGGKSFVKREDWIAFRDTRLEKDIMWRLKKPDA